ncbi:unnamed protein product, partial [Dovyalis caffra]
VDQLNEATTLGNRPIVGNQSNGQDSYRPMSKKVGKDIDNVVANDKRESIIHYNKKDMNSGDQNASKSDLGFVSTMAYSAI